MKRLTISLFVLISILFLAACGSSGDDEASTENGSEDNEGILAQLQEEGKIKIGFANEKPYGYENDEGELTGASVDTAKAVFAELGIDEVEGHLADYDQLVPGLGAGKYHAITYLYDSLPLCYM